MGEAPHEDQELLCRFSLHPHGYGCGLPGSNDFCAFAVQTNVGASAKRQAISLSRILAILSPDCRAAVPRRRVFSCFRLAETGKLAILVLRPCARPPYLPGR